MPPRSFLRCRGYTRRRPQRSIGQRGRGLWPWTGRSWRKSYRQNTRRTRWPRPRTGRSLHCNLCNWKPRQPSRCPPRRRCRTRLRRSNLGSGRCCRRCTQKRRSRCTGRWRRGWSPPRGLWSHSSCPRHKRHSSTGRSTLDSGRRCNCCNSTRRLRRKCRCCKLLRWSCQARTGSPRGKSGKLLGQWYLQTPASEDAAHCMLCGRATSCLFVQLIVFPGGIILTEAPSQTLVLACRAACARGRGRGVRVSARAAERAARGADR
jgi:hypothetical protein